MGIILYKEPQLEKPDMLACWPGIGNVGLVAVDTLRAQTRAEELGEIEPWDFFYPKKVIIRDGVLTDMEFPGSKFYFKRLARKDLLIFMGEEQPADGGLYAGGNKAYRMANMVIDVAEKFGCRRIYTSGAAVSLTYHEQPPRVWAVTGSDELNREIRRCSNTVLMGEIEGREESSITGLNGLLLGVAKKRGLEAVCLMGEIPDYLSRAPFPYPRASKAVLEVMADLLNVEIDYDSLDEMVEQVDDLIETIYSQFPPDIKEKIEQRKSAEQAGVETITEDDERWLKEHINEFFQKGERGNEKPS